MRGSQKKLLIFEAIIFAILCINSFVSNILSQYYLVLFLAVCLVLTRILFGCAKQRQRYEKDVLFDVIIILIIFFILFYVLGFFIGYARINDYQSWYGYKTFIIPLVLQLIFREILRYRIAIKVEDSKLLLITTVALFVMIEITNTIYYTDFRSAYNTFVFVAMYFLPAISTSIACTYITRKVGYKPVLLYLLVIELYVYYIPIIPNPDKYLTSVIHLVLPVILGLRILSFFKFEEDRQVERNYNKQNPLGIIIPIALIIVIVYLTSGYFKYYAVAVATGSMEPNIHRGDVVIIEQMKSGYDKLEVGDVLAYRYSGVIVIHRIIKISKDGDEYFFYTKGDNNNSEDNHAIKQSDVVGIVNHKLTYLGLPTVWLNNI